MDTAEKLWSFLKESNNIWYWLLAVIVLVAIFIFKNRDLIRIRIGYDPVVKILEYSKTKPASERRREFYQTVSDIKFVIWRTKVLKLIYGEPAVVKLGGKEYPISCIYSIRNGLQFPFSSLTKDGLDSTEIDSDRKLKKTEKDYWEVISETISGAERIGYTVNEIILDKDKNVSSIRAGVCSYKQNVISCHILEYELYREFKRLKRYGLLQNEIAPNILKRLKLRDNIHAGQSLDSILLKGKNRNSQFGVQALLLYKSEKGGTHDYGFRIIKRSGETSIRKGYFQFIPSGGFEIFENNPSKAEIRREFNIEKAILREFLEEVYGVRDLGDCSADSLSSNDLIYKNPATLDLLDLINEGKARFMFIGTVFDYIVLRHELSFLIIIDDPEFKNKHNERGSEEGRVIQYENIEEVFDLLTDEKEIINPGSAGLFKLALELELFRKLVFKGERTKLLAEL